LIEKQAIFFYVNHARIRPCHQPVQSNDSGKVSCSKIIQDNTCKKVTNSDILTTKGSFWH